jgi:hypothetical protein
MMFSVHMRAAGSVTWWRVMRVEWGDAGGRRCGERRVWFGGVEGVHAVEGSAE